MVFVLGFRVRVQGFWVWGLWCRAVQVLGFGVCGVLGLEVCQGVNKRMADLKSKSVCDLRFRDSSLVPYNLPLFKV